MAGKRAKPLTVTDEMLTVGEIAELLEVSVKTVRRWIASGELGAVRAGNGTERHVVRVPRASLAAFLEARRTG